MLQQTSESSLIDFLLQRNKQMSALYCDSDTTLARRQYRQQHPTEIAALECMDGRLNLSLITGTPPGIFHPFRNLGGQFDLGWSFFGSLIKEWVDYSISKGRHCLVFVTYHWSHSNKHLGCKGFAYDKSAAQKYTQNLKKQIERVFGSSHSVVYPIQVGIETDEDALILHGQDGQIFDLAKEELNEESIIAQIDKLYPDMKTRIKKDIMPIVLGNQRHVNKIRESKRSLSDVDHKEQILIIGQEIDWLYLPNRALIVGPYSHNLSEPITVAAKIILDNLCEGKVPESEGVVLMTSAAFRNQTGPGPILAAEKAKSLAEFAFDTIASEVPELKKYLSLLMGTTNLKTRLFTRIPFSV